MEIIIAYIYIRKEAKQYGIVWRNDFEIEFSSGSTGLEKGITELGGYVSEKALTKWSRTSL